MWRYKADTKTPALSGSTVMSQMGQNSHNDLNDIMTSIYNGKYCRNNWAADI